jgi:oxygen-dependent protoporphyrinogen oxidase
MSAARPRLAVVGGGIAGLAAAHRLVELARERGVSPDLHLLEGGSRLGGSIATERTDGFVLESGPDSFISEKPAALRLCERLGLTPRLIGTREENRRTFIVHGGRLHPLPDGFLLLAPTRFAPFLTTRLFSWRGKARMALDLVLPRGRPRSDESLGSFVTRRLGREALERVAQPLVGGIYTADPDTLSLAATMPRFLEMERRERSLILAMWRQQRRAAAAAHTGSGARWSLFVSLDDGMQTLVDRLAQRLPEGVVRLRTRVIAIRREEGTWRLALEGGARFEADAVVVASPAHRSARLLASVDAGVSSELAAIPYASSATVSLAFREADFGKPLDGFGFVVPAVESRGIIACTYSSMKYSGRAPEGHVLLRAFVGGALQQQRFDDDDATMLANVREELADLLGITAEPLLARVHRHAQAMPQYQVGHLDRMARIDARLAKHPGLALCGNAYRGVGIPDCIRSAEEAAERVWDCVAGGSE